MYPIDLSGKTGIVFGIANQRSIAWAIAQILREAGVRLAIAYQNPRLGESVEKLVGGWEDTPLIECDVSSDDSVAKAFDKVAGELGHLDVVVHSIAFANREDLGGPLHGDRPRGVPSGPGHQRLLAGLHREARPPADVEAGREHGGTDLSGLHQGVPRV